eukprot:g872.t1
MHEHVGLNFDSDLTSLSSIDSNTRRSAPALAKILRENWRNWFCFCILVLFFCLAEFVAKPHKRHISERELSYLSFPESDETVPGFIVPICSLLVPTGCYLHHYYINRDIHEFHDVMFGSLMSLALTALTTSSLKVYTGRPRPDFIYRCFGRTNISEILLHDLNCTTHDEAAINEGWKSFPSGHSSWMMCSMSFLSLFLIAKLQVFSGKGPGWSLVFCLLPITFAVFVGLTRFHDYRHHWSDVVAGFGIGIFFAVVMYTTYYPSPFQRKGAHIPLYMQRRRHHEYNRIEADEVELVSLAKV